MLVPLEKPTRDVSFGQKERELSALSKKVVSDIQTALNTADKIQSILKSKEQEFLHYSGEDSKSAVNAMNWTSDLYKRYVDVMGSLLQARSYLAPQQLERYCNEMTKYFG